MVRVYDKSVKKDTKIKKLSIYEIHVLKKINNFANFFHFEKEIVRYSCCRWQ